MTKQLPTELKFLVMSSLDDQRDVLHLAMASPVFRAEGLDYLYRHNTSEVLRHAVKPKAGRCKTAKERFAIIRQCIMWIDKAIEYGADINMRFYFDSDIPGEQGFITALHIAASQLQHELIDHLIKRGADLHSEGFKIFVSPDLPPGLQAKWNGLTIRRVVDEQLCWMPIAAPLLMAHCGYQRGIETARMMINHGHGHFITARSDPGASSRKSRRTVRPVTITHLLCNKMFHIGFAESVLEKWPESTGVPSGLEYIPPISLAIKNRNYEMANLLLQHNVAIHDEDSFNRTALTWAVKAVMRHDGLDKMTLRRATDMVEQLISYGVSVDMEDDQSQRTPLAQALTITQPDWKNKSKEIMNMAESLLRAGADINAVPVNLSATQAFVDTCAKLE